MKPLLLILTILTAVSCNVKNPVHFDLKSILDKNPEISMIQNEVLKITPTSENQSLTVWEGNEPQLWENANYLVCEIWHSNDFSGILNYNIGFMDICNQPYKELVDAAKLTHLKMYEVASGKEKPFDEVVEKIPSIHY